MHIDSNDFFRDVTLRICSSLDIDQALFDTFQYIRKYIPADTMGLGFSDLATGKIHVVAKCAIDGAQYIWDDENADILLAENQEEYVRTKPKDDPPALIVNRPDNHPVPLVELFPQLQHSSALFLRLDIRGEEVGAILISAEGQDRYCQVHADLIETVQEPFAIAMINARRYRELEQLKNLLTEDNRALSADIHRSVGLEVVGADFGLKEVMEQVRQIAQSPSPALLLGETGTGKEVIANAIHRASPRNNGPLISMQCGAIPDTLLDSELFGHEKGAFTGAANRKRGRFERAHGGTLFLDEIGELSPEAQVKLLRVLQEKQFERVGGTKTVEVDVRVIAATHRDLEKMVRAGTFREDLWYRLNVLPIRIPPLRLRREDIPPLIHFFIERKAGEMNLQRIPRVTSYDIEKLKKYDWPGNVRELQNIVERALILSRGESLSFPDFSNHHSIQQERPNSPSINTKLTLDEAMGKHIRAVLDDVYWKISGDGGAAEVLNIKPSTLYFRMDKLGIKRPKTKS